MTRVLLIIACALGLGACKPKAPIVEPTLPSLQAQFSCLPDGAAFVAAHRGTSKNTVYPENAAGSLQALIDAGILFAEVDVAGLKDGTHVLFHDGVWESKSTGKGAVAATNWDAAQGYLLNDTRGQLSAETVPTLADILALAKNKIYLEIDFKSSAKYESVIQSIHETGVEGQVILIAYNLAQARRLADLAPDMMISAPVKDLSDIKALNSVGVQTRYVAAWMGSDEFSGLAGQLQAKSVPVLRSAPRNKVKVAANFADVLVSDYALEFGPFVGMSEAGTARYRACLGQ